MALNEANVVPLKIANLQFQFAIACTHSEQGAGKAKKR